MALHSSWEGFLRLSLVSVPVKAYSALSAERGGIHFNQIHKDCGNRIQYRKVCPTHGEVTKEEIVSGYKIAKDEYVLVDPTELAKLRTENDKAISIEEFIAAGALDPTYYTDRTYYLTPDGRVAEKPYAVLQRVMEEEQKQGLATMVLSGRERLVLVRPIGSLIGFTVLSYAEQVKKPAAFADDVPDVAVSDKELELARTLVEATTVKKLDLSKYEDRYTGRVEKLLEAKAAGKRITAPRAEHGPAVINLMDALRQSLDQAHSGDTKPHKKPPRRKASSRTARRKTG